MLRLTGRRADGWLPSLGYLQPGDLARGNEVIDEAAVSAGRVPAAVRRLLNVNGSFSARSRGPLQGPPEQWAEELAGMALADGVSGFVLGADDPDALRAFAAEVAPAVRELVAAERQALAAGPVGGVAAGAGPVGGVAAVPARRRRPRPRCPARAVPPRPPPPRARPSSLLSAWSRPPTSGSA